MPSIGLSLVDSTDNIGSVFNRLLGVESSLIKFKHKWDNLRVYLSYLGQEPWYAR